MSVQCNGTLEVFETELADVDLGEARVVSGIGGGVPHTHLMTAKLYQSQSVLLSPFTISLQWGMHTTHSAVQCERSCSMCRTVTVAAKLQR